ncbi:MAG: YicC/YloC family endoribonuclease, partial [Rhizomicrobium sp.]
MSIVSMTGFAESAGSHEGLRWRWEAKSVNGRGLDLRLRTPPGYDSLEQPARVLAAERFRRGNFQIALTVEADGGTRGLRVDPVALASAVKLAREISAETGLAPARVDGLLALKGVIVQEETNTVDPVARGHRDAHILKSLAVTFDALNRARVGEGTKLAQLLSAQINEVARLVDEAENLAAAQPEALRQKLAAQLQE